MAAGYLQKSGLSVAVVERIKPPEIHTNKKNNFNSIGRHVVGGAAVTEEIIPGFKFSRASYVLSLLRPYIIKDLKLKVLVFSDSVQYNVNILLLSGIWAEVLFSRTI